MEITRSMKVTELDGFSAIQSRGVEFRSSRK